MAKKKEMRVCSCGGPLIWTFLYSGAEYFCLNCHRSFGMLGAGKIVDSTPKLVAQAKVAVKVFKALQPSLIGDGGFMRTGCKICDEKNEYHTNHLSEKEKAADKAAQQILKVIRDYL